MDRGAQVGLLLSMLLGVLWVVTFAAGWSIWPGVVASMLVGIYWAVGRQMIFGNSPKE